MQSLTSKGKLRWAVDVANGEIVPDLEQLENFIRAPWMLYDFGPEGKPIRSTRTPSSGWPRFFSDTAEAFRGMLETAAKQYPLTPPPPPKRSPAVFNPKVKRYVEPEQIQIQSLPTLLLARLYDLTLEHGHLLSHCQAPAPMKRGPRPKGMRNQKPKGVCGKLFLGKKLGQLYHSLTCSARVAGHRKRKGPKRPK